MRVLILLCLLLSSCKSSFFAYERQLPAYEPDQRIEILKLARQEPEYYIFKARAVEYRIPFYFMTEDKFTVGEVVFFAKIRGGTKMWYF